MWRRSRAFMKSIGSSVAMLVISTVIVAPAYAGEGDWPSFRGASASGIGQGSVPMSWDVDSAMNIKWKTPIPGLGHSSPIVWGDRVYVTSAISGGGDHDLRVGLYRNVAPVQDDSVHVWKLYCLDKSSGKTALLRSSRITMPLWVKLPRRGNVVSMVPEKNGP